MYMRTSENFEFFQQLSLTTCTSKSEMLHIYLNDLFSVIEIVMNKMLLIS